MSVTPAKPVLVSDAAVQRPSREQALEAVRTLIAWAGDDPIEFGEVKEGYLADLLLMDGDPLADITLFQDQDNFLMIMKNGEYHKTPRRRRVSRRRVAAAE